MSKTQHIQEGFHRLFCLVPYDIISAELWNHIMPNWLEAILQDVPEDELPELKIILRSAVCAVESGQGTAPDGGVGAEEGLSEATSV